MTQFDPPQQSPEADQFQQEMQPVGPVPVSGMAIAGLISSILMCCPVLSPLLGIIFSLVGLSETKSGRKRGHVVAILGILFAVLGLGVQGVFGYHFYKASVPSIAMITGMQEILASDQESRLAAADRLYQVTAIEFQSSVSQQQFEDWVEQQYARLGAPQKEVVPSMFPKPSNQPNSLIYEFIALFPDGEKMFKTEIATGFAKFEVLDVIIDDQSVLSGLVESPSDESPSDLPVASQPATDNNEE